MLLTPTYYILDMYQYHQDATLIPLQFNSPDYVYGNESIPAINASASRDSNGAVHITLVNLDPKKEITINTTVPSSLKSVTGEILNSEKYTDINTFDNPGKVKLKAFTGAVLKGSALNIKMPALSAVMLELK
jgi:alpha-N-arabinofuranosidase